MSKYAVFEDKACVKDELLGWVCRIIPKGSVVLIEEDGLKLKDERGVRRIDHLGDVRPLSRRKGLLVQVREDAEFPDGSREYYLIRNPPRYRQLTETQKRVKLVGERIRKECKGLRGSDFASCRARVAKEVFKKD